MGLAIPPPELASIILKVAARCNLDCSYCYVFRKEDSTWKRRPPVMPDEIFDGVLARIRRHCAVSGQSRLHLHFHGGEPFLIGAGKFDRWCTKLRQELEDLERLELGIQTNGTLLDSEWAEVLLKHGVEVGISIDGTQALHDHFRVDHAGRGSYDKVVRGLRVLQDHQIPFGVLTVLQPGADPLSIHEHHVSLGCRRITYLLPDYTHDNVAPIRQLYGPTPCADFLIPIFDHWWSNGTIELQIRDLWNVARIIMGGASRIETFGNRPPRYVFVESDGDIEGLDCLRSCKEGLAGMGLNVMSNDFSEILETNTMHADAIFRGVPVPQACQGCPERDTCAGGYLPHRYSTARGFDNPSVWCADILKLFSHIRQRLGVSVQETLERREKLGRVVAKKRTSSRGRQAAGRTGCRVRTTAVTPP